MATCIFTSPALFKSFCISKVCRISLLSKENNSLSLLCETSYNPLLFFFFSIFFLFLYNSTQLQPTWATVHSTCVSPSCSQALTSFYLSILKLSHASPFVQFRLFFEHPLSFLTSSMNPLLTTLKFTLLLVPVFDLVVICLLQLACV